MFKVSSMVFGLLLGLNLHASYVMPPEISVAPANNMWIGTDVRGGITQDQFNQTIDRVHEIYDSIVAAHGATLDIKRLWEDGTVNASTTRYGNTWVVNMYGGLARHNIVTQDAFALVVCHEMGHQLGGSPYKTSWWGDSWASAEGQSDYFGALKCLRKYLELESDNQTFVDGMEVDSIAATMCDQVWADGEEAAICKRTAMAGKALASLLGTLGSTVIVPSFATPDKNVVSTTNKAGYPAVQCRMDTYTAGALCTVSSDEDINPADIKSGQCNDLLDPGSRPRCWFKP